MISVQKQALLLLAVGALLGAAALAPGISWEHSALTVAALATVAYAVLTYNLLQQSIKQSTIAATQQAQSMEQVRFAGEQVNLLRDQIDLLQRDLEANERKRTERQARSVAVWYADAPQSQVTVYVRNTSGMPVYDMTLRFVAAGDGDMIGPGYQRALGVVLPGAQEEWQHVNLAGRDEGYKLLMEFRDSYGRFWRSEPHAGRLTDITASRAEGARRA